MEFNTIVQIVNIATCIGIGAALTFAMLSRVVRDGIVIKAGLGSMILGFLVTTMHLLSIKGADVQGLERGIMLINVGLGVVIVGYLFKVHTAGHALSRATDWADYGPEQVPEDAT